MDGLAWFFVVLGFGLVLVGVLRGILLPDGNLGLDDVDRVCHCEDRKNGVYSGGASDCTLRCNGRDAFLNLKKN